MTTGSRRAKITSWLSANAWLLDVLIAACLIALGIAGLLWAMQSRPYTGAAATDLAQVPMRVVTAPNVTILGLFILSVGLAVTGAAWFVVRGIHWRFFAPVKAWRVWRQAFFIGLFVVGSAWLRINQAMSVPLMAAMALALVLIEVFLNVRSAASSE